MVTLRKDVTAKLKAGAKANAASSKWRVDTGVAVPANLENPFVLVTLRAWSPHPAAPRLYWTSELVATLFVAEQDPAKSADAFEDNGEVLTELVEALDYPGAVWTRTERVTYDDRPALDVIFTITNGKVEP